MNSVNIQELITYHFKSFQLFALNTRTGQKLVSTTYYLVLTDTVTAKRNEDGQLTGPLDWTTTRFREVNLLRNYCSIGMASGFGVCLDSSGGWILRADACFIPCLRRPPESTTHSSHTAFFSLQTLTEKVSPYFLFDTLFIHAFYKKQCVRIWSSKGQHLKKMLRKSRG